MRFKQHSVLPGFGLGLGYTLFWLCLIVLLPLAALLMKSASLSAEAFWAIVSTDRVVAALKLSFGASLLAASLNAFFGFLVAWVLVRYPFPGKRLVDALVDLPFALPTAVAGISLTTLYAPNGWFGQYLVPLGINPLKDVKTITVPPPQMVANMRVGNMDGFCVAATFTTSRRSRARTRTWFAGLIALLSLR